MPFSSDFDGPQSNSSIVSGVVSSECGQPPENVANTIEDEFKNNDESSLKRNYSYSFTGGVRVKLD